MAEGWETALRNAAAKIAQYVEDVATMTVETRYVQVSADGPVDFSQARPVAQTVLKLDGDTTATIPLYQMEAGRFEVATGLLDLHQRNVDTAIEYRARILHALLNALQALGR